jgi:hypothetical protein
MSDFAVRKPDLLQVSLGQKGIILLAAHIQKLVLYGRTSTVDYKNFHISFKLFPKTDFSAANLTKKAVP